MRRASDHSILVRDVARVEDGEEEVESAALLTGVPTVLLIAYQGVTTGAVLRISTKTVPELLTAKTAISGGPVL